MRRSLVVSLVVLACVGGWVGRQALGEDAPGGGGMPSEEEIAKMMEALGTPGEPHKWLAQAEGEWTVSGKSYPKPGVVEEVSGTATFKMLLDGRWQEQVLRTSFQGKPYEGRGWTGYDNAKKEFVNYWIDSMSTGPSVGTGPWEGADKPLTTKGSWDMPGFKMDFRSVVTVKSAKEMTFAMHGTFGGQEMLLMEITYTRK